MNKRILVITAHPDDELLGCGATIFQHSQKGDIIEAVILGEGITSRSDLRNREEVDSEIQNLRKNIESARNILGISKTYVFDFPDNRFDSVALLDIVKAVEKIKSEFKPDVIFTHFENDLNIDHRITYNAVLTACRPMEDETVKEIYSFEVPSATEWQVSSSNNIFNPNYFVEISEEALSKKLKAMACYESESRKYPHPRSPKALKIISQRWGINVGRKFVESFILVRKID